MIYPAPIAVLMDLWTGLPRPRPSSRSRRDPACDPAPAPVRLLRRGVAALAARCEGNASRIVRGIGDGAGARFAPQTRVAPNQGFQSRRCGGGDGGSGCSGSGGCTSDGGHGEFKRAAGQGGRSVDAFGGGGCNRGCCERSVAGGKGGARDGSGEGFGEIDLAGGHHGGRKDCAHGNAWFVPWKSQW